MSVNVLVVDDSAVVRKFMESVVADGEFLVTTASDPLVAMRKMESFRPDVILLDLEMPRMDGLTFLHKQMSKDPIPTVIFSRHVEEGNEIAFRAIEEGAVEILTKPSLALHEYLETAAEEIRDTLRIASKARPRRSLAATDSRILPAAVPVLSTDTWGGISADRVIAIGGSTGGIEILHELLGFLPPETPGIVVAQHMPAIHSGTLAQRLNKKGQLNVREAAEGDRVKAGTMLLAPGDRHMRVVRDPQGYHVEVFDAPSVSSHRPSADVLFRSVATAAGKHGIGVILTGMGDDGVAGLLDLHEAGGKTIAQDEDSCVVFGMPKRAIDRGAVDHVAPPWQIARLMLGIDD